MVFGHAQRPSCNAMVTVFEAWTSAVLRQGLGLLSTQRTSDCLWWHAGLWQRNCRPRRGLWLRQRSDLGLMLYTTISSSSTVPLDYDWFVCLKLLTWRNNLVSWILKLISLASLFMHIYIYLKTPLTCFTFSYIPPPSWVDMICVSTAMGSLVNYLPVCH